MFGGSWSPCTSLRTSLGFAGEFTSLVLCARWHAESAAAFKMSVEMSEPVTNRGDEGPPQSVPGGLYSHGKKHRRNEVC